MLDFSNHLVSLNPTLFLTVIGKFAFSQPIDKTLHYIYFYNDQFYNFTQMCVTVEKKDLSQHLLHLGKQDGTYWSTGPI